MAHSMSEEELKEVYRFALDLGRRAGKILLEGVEKRTGEQSGRDVGSVEEKMNAVDIVRIAFPQTFPYNHSPFPIPHSQFQISNSQFPNPHASIH